MTIKEKEFYAAVYSYHSYLLTFGGKKDDFLEVFNSWMKASNFIFTDKPTMLLAIEAAEMMTSCPLNGLIVTAEQEIIPDFRDFLKYDEPPLL